MFRRDRLKIYFLLIGWIALNVGVWILQRTPFDWIRVGSSVGTLVVIGLLAWIWHRRYRTELERRALESSEEPEDSVR